ncbi:hypothetical protein ACLB2K_072701 [Fragaria x ananassa]
MSSLHTSSSSKASKNSFASLSLSSLGGNPSMTFLGVSSSSSSKNSMSNYVVGSQTFSIDEVTRSFVAPLNLPSSLGFQNPSQASSTTQTLSINEVIKSFAASLVLAKLKVVNFSYRVFAPLKKKRIRLIGSRNKKGQNKTQEEEKSPTITPPPVVPPSPSLKVGSQEITFHAHRPVRKLVDQHLGYLAMVKDHRYHIGNVLLQAPQEDTMIRYMYS